VITLLGIFTAIEIIDVSPFQKRHGETPDLFGGAVVEFECLTAAYFSSGTPK
jgi:hypothetical protein